MLKFAIGLERGGQMSLYYNQEKSYESPYFDIKIDMI